MQELAKQGVALDESAFGEAKSEIATLVDELGLDTGNYAAAKKTIKTYEDRRKILIAKATAAALPEEDVTVHGDQFSVTIAAAQEKRTITDKAVIFDALGNDVFVKLANFSLGDLDKYLNPAQLDKALTKERIGARKVTVGTKGAL